VQSYAHSVADAMAREGVRDAVLVGHSMCGIVIPKVAELVPARVRHLVFLAAVVLPSGASLDQQFPLAARPRCTGGARAAGSAARRGVAPIYRDSDHGPRLSHVDELGRVLEKI